MSATDPSAAVDLSAADINPLGSAASALLVALEDAERWAGACAGLPAGPAAAAWEFAGRAALAAERELARLGVDPAGGPRRVRGGPRTLTVATLADWLLAMRGGAAGWGERTAGAWIPALGTAPDAAGARARLELVLDAPFSWGMEAEAFADAHGPPPSARHSPDFSYAFWFGAEHHFTATQAAVVRQLWEAWEAGTPPLRGDTLLEQSESEQNRLVDVFKRRGRLHPAWGTMIVQSGEVKGVYFLRPPAPKKNRRSRKSPGKTPP